MTKIYTETQYDIENYIAYLNTKFLHHTLWKIYPQQLQENPTLKKEIEDKQKEMKKWAEETIKASFSYKIERQAYQIVTLGTEPAEKANKLYTEDRYEDYFYWHGYCAALTEALAAKVHSIIRVVSETETKEIQSPQREFEQQYIGKRISYGYEELPNIEEQREILKILKAHKIGIEMTESGMLAPVYSTCAIVHLQ